MGFKVREARLGDLDAAARVRAACWRESFGELVPADVLDNADAWAPDVAEKWAAKMLDRGCTYWLAVDPAHDGETVGIAHAHAAHEPDAPASLCLETLYVLDRAKGSGIADVLVHRAIGDEVPAYLWVIEGNDRALRFYARHGFLPDGTARDIKPGWPGGRQVRLVRAPLLDEDD